MSFCWQKFLNIFCRTIFQNYKLDPAKVLTISSTALQSALLQLNLKIDVIRDTNSLKDFEDNIRGRLVSVVRSKTTSNNEYLSNHDKNENNKTIVFLDVNALYGSILCLLLQIGGFFKLPPEEVQKFDFKTTKLDGEYCYVLLLDYEIPDQVKDQTDDLPLSI